MKRIAASILAISLMGSAAFAQGTVAFNNSGTTLVTANGSAVPVGAASGYGGLLLGLFWGAQGAAQGELVQIGGTTTINPLAGRYSGGQRTTGAGTAPGGTATFQVRAWSADRGATWAEASISTVAGFMGQSTLFNSATGGAGTPASPAVPLANTAPGFAVVLVPEPSVVALALLGGAALLLRRRKA